MGTDEAAVRAKLVAMQERIVRDPAEALGVSMAASGADVRAAFLQLAKTYHPTRFGRMTPDVQRLANEVFLALRAAHDSLAKSRPARTATPATTTGPVPIRPPLPPAPSAALAVGTARTASTAPPATSRIPSRPATVPPATRPAARPAQTGALPIRPRTAEIPPLQKPRSPDEEVAAALELLNRAQWDAGRAALQQLADKHPAVPKYRALVSYALGRQAQLEQRSNEARIELDRALQIDPTLQVAKTALAELFTRRK